MISLTVPSTIIYSALIYFLYRFLRYFVNLQQAYRTLEPVPGPTIRESLLILWAFYRKRLNGFFNQKLSVPIGTAVKELARELCDRYGGDKGVVKVGYGLFPPYVYVCDGKLAKEVLAHPSFQNKADIHRFLGAVVTGNSLLTCETTQAKVYRLELRKHFTNRSLESYLATFEKHLAVLNDKINLIVDSKTKGVIEDIKPTISTLVLDTIGENLFSTRFSAQKAGRKEPQFITDIDRCLTEADWLLIEQWKTTSGSFVIMSLAAWLGPMCWKLLALAGRVISFKLAMIRLVLKIYWKVFWQRRKLGDHYQPPSTMMGAVVDRQMSAFYSSNLSPLTFYTGFRDAFWHLSIFMLAGHQTSTMTLTWALYYLCRHETVRQKLQEEVDDFLKNKEENSPQEMTEVLTDKSALKYLEAVIKETMRLAPAGPYLGRKATVDVILPVNFAEDSGKPTEFITIPAGTNVIVMSQYMHYSERYFREAGSFIPERWLKAMEKTELEILPPPCYNPFSAGTRACIGEKYAMLQMKLALLSLCSKFDFTFAHPDTTVCTPLHHMVQRSARFAVKFSHRRRNNNDA